MKYFVRASGWASPAVMLLIKVPAPGVVKYCMILLFLHWIANLVYVFAQLILRRLLHREYGLLNGFSTGSSKCNYFIRVPVQLPVTVSVSRRVLFL